MQMLLLLFGVVGISAGLEQPACFGKLQGQVDECYCSIQDVDTTHSTFFKELAELMTRDYFRYYKVHLHNKCLFWENMGECTRKTCALKTCSEAEVPAGLTGHNKATEPTCEEEKELSKINNVISATDMKRLKKIHAEDEIQFCVEEDEELGVYYDLLQNPERYTGYSGEEAHRIWRSIYNENCFKPKKDSVFLDLSHKSINYMCKEKRVFFRAISGLHASISIHLSAKYPLEDFFGEKWGRNLAEFSARFMPESTEGEGPYWLKNLYFVYLLEMRALTKGLPLWRKMDFSTGDPAEDAKTKEKLLAVVETFLLCPDTFDEAQLFKGPAAPELISDFLVHFRNISQIMDCVTCDKCRLWGKVQTRGLGTALKLLFSNGEIAQLQLDRGEVVTLFNAFNQLSHSISYVQQFKHDLDSSDVTDRMSDTIKPKRNIFGGFGSKSGEL